MNIAVCLKFVPDIRDIEVQDDDFVGVENARMILSENDARALEAAKQFAKENNGSVVAVSINQYRQIPAQLSKEVLARGAESLYIVEDAHAFLADSHTIAQILASALHRIGTFDLVICGAGSDDYSSQQVGLHLGKILGAVSINEIGSFSLMADGLHVERWLEKEIEELVISLPAVCSTNSSVAELTAPGLLDLAKAAKKPVVSWNLNDINMAEMPSVSVCVVGMSNKEEETPETNSMFPVLVMLEMLRSGNHVKRRHIMLTGNPQVAATDLVNALERENVL